MADFAAVLSVVLLAVHLLAMNVPSAAPLVCVWLHGRGRCGDHAADAVGRQLAEVSLWSLLIGTLLGAILIALLWAADDRGYWNALERFPARAYGFALGELAFTAACLILYVAMWDRWRGRPRLLAFVALLATTNLLYHFPPLMVVIGNLASRPELVQADVVTRPVFRDLLVRPDLLAQVLHFIIASVAVAGIALMLFARRYQTMSQPGEPVDRLIAAGARVALVATLTQLAVGVWVLIQLPGVGRTALLGDDWLAGTMFFLSVLATFGVLHALAAVALGDTRGVAVRRAAVLMLTVVVLMTGTLTRARTIEAANSRRATLAGNARCLSVAVFPFAKSRRCDEFPGT